MTSGSEWGPGLTSLDQGLVVSSSLLGALAGSVAVLALGDRLGRRSELLGASALYLVGALVMASASSLPFLLLGRSIYGFGIGKVEVLTLSNMELNVSSLAYQVLLCMLLLHILPRLALPLSGDC